MESIKRPIPFPQNNIILQKLFPAGVKNFSQTPVQRQVTRGRSKVRTSLAKSGKFLQKLKIRENIWNLPNVLTISRLAVSPVIGYFILNEQYKLALGAFVYAGLTDLLDGFVARRYKMKTTVGTVIDPLADKTLMTIMTVTLSMKSFLPTPIAAVILGRDGCLILSSFYYRYISLPPPKTITRYFDFAIPSAEVRPTTISKVNTALQLALMGSTLACAVYGSIDFLWIKALQYTVFGTTIWSGFSYILSKDAVRILTPRVHRRHR